MKLYFVMPKVIQTRIYQEVFQVCTEKDEAIFIAKQQRSVRPGTYYDVFEMDGKVVYDGEKGR